MIRELLPDASIGTDLIAGFPGEDDAAFARTLAFVEASPITYGHVFPYSVRQRHDRGQARRPQVAARRSSRTRAARLRAALRPQARRVRAALRRRRRRGAGRDDARSAHAARCAATRGTTCARVSTARMPGWAASCRSRLRVGRAARGRGGGAA